MKKSRKTCKEMRQTLNQKSITRSWAFKMKKIIQRQRKIRKQMKGCIKSKRKVQKYNKNKRVMREQN